MSTNPDSLERIDCPCPAECERHGCCGPCREYHHERGGLTYCEQVAQRGGQDRAGPVNGREFRLMDYGACAG